MLSCVVVCINQIIMSYQVQLFPLEVKKAYFLSKSPGFLEKVENLIPFTAGQKQRLKDRLSKYGYRQQRTDPYGHHYVFDEDESINALLTDHGLYFSATGEGAFEIGMTASEFTDTEEFAKYDPQNGGWEEI